MKSGLAKPKTKQVGSVLVVGGGIGGIQAALDLAESGYYVYLLEKSPSIGGIMAQLDKTFPTNDCSMCILSPKLVDAGRHLNIQLITNAELKDVSGEAGRFKVRITRRPRWVGLDKCTGCGLCAQSDLSEVRTLDGEVWVDRIKIDESKCIQCGDCVQACTVENKDKHGLTTIALERKQLIQLPPPESVAKPADTLVQQIALMDHKSRMKFWEQEFSKCMKCFGCRDVCPICICDKCEMEDAEWIDPGRIPPQFLFHLIRAYHVADLCIGCGECEATCPAGIPLRALQSLVHREPPETVFDYVPGLAMHTKERLIRQVKENPISKRGIRI